MSSKITVSKDKAGRKIYYRGGKRISKEAALRSEKSSTPKKGTSKKVNYPKGPGGYESKYKTCQSELKKAKQKYETDNKFLLSKLTKVEKKRDKCLSALGQIEEALGKRMSSIEKGVKYIKEQERVTKALREELALLKRNSEKKLDDAYVELEQEKRLYSLERADLIAEQAEKIKRLKQKYDQELDDAYVLLEKEKRLGSASRAYLDKKHKENIRKIEQKYTQKIQQLESEISGHRLKAGLSEWEFEGLKEKIEEQQEKHRIVEKQLDDAYDNLQYLVDELEHSDNLLKKASEQNENLARVYREKMMEMATELSGTRENMIQNLARAKSDLESLKEEL